MAKTIVGSFDTFDEAQKVMAELHQRGFNQNDISIVANNASGQYVTDTTATPTRATAEAGGAASGAAAGGLLGGAAGLIVGLMGLAIPGIGAIVAAGPLAATLAGAGVGAVAGGLIGGLTRVGVPEEEANAYAEAVRRGGALVTVRAEDDRAEEAAELMRMRGAIDIERRAELWRGQGWTRYDPSAQPYTADELVRERELRGSAPVMATTDDTWREQSQHFRLHSADYGTLGHEEFEPAYRYGWGLSRDQRYRGRDWLEIEPTVRRDWGARYPGSNWERVKTAVRRGWERTTEAVARAVPGDSDHDGR